MSQGHQSRVQAGALHTCDVVTGDLVTLDEQDNGQAVFDVNVLLEFRRPTDPECLAQALSRRDAQLRKDQRRSEL